jgi:hypothetical protein
VGRHEHTTLREPELPIVVEQSIEGFKDVRRREIKLVEDEPVAVTDSTHEGAFLEHEAPVRATRPLAKILLQVGVLVVVDSSKNMPCEAREMRYKCSLDG